MLNIACFKVVAFNLQVINEKTVLIENKCFDSRLSKLVLKTGVGTYKNVLLYLTNITECSKMQRVGGNDSQATKSSVDQEIVIT